RPGQDGLPARAPDTCATHAAIPSKTRPRSPCRGSPGPGPPMWSGRLATTAGRIPGRVQSSHHVSTEPKRLWLTICSRSVRLRLPTYRLSTLRAPKDSRVRPGRRESNWWWSNRSGHGDGVDDLSPQTVQRAAKLLDARDQAIVGDQCQGGDDDAA